jgi:hypothetical protein
MAFRPTGILFSSGCLGRGVLGRPLDRIEQVFITRNEMSTETIAMDEHYVEEMQPYRAISRSAVVSFVLSILSLSAWLSPVLLFLPLLGAIAGIVARGKFRRYPDELTGRVPAVIGLVLNVATLIAAGGWHSYVYATEVPDGYRRISFADLQPEPNAPQMSFPLSALELDGQRIFIKGYVFPDGQQYDIQRFILVPDMGTCCFGGQPALTDMIEVTLRDPLRVEFALRKRKLAGTFSVDGSLKPVNGVGGVVYQLDADYVR